MQRACRSAGLIFPLLIYRRQTDDNNEEANVYLHHDDMDYYSSLLSFCTIDGALKSIPLYFPPPNLYYSSALTLPPLAFGAQPSAVTGCHSFISSLHHSLCPSEDVGIHLSIHLSAPFSLTSGNDKERQRGEGYEKKKERERGDRRERAYGRRGRTRDAGSDGKAQGEKTVI